MFVDASNVGMVSSCSALHTLTSALAKGLVDDDDRHDATGAKADDVGGDGHKHFS